jgi:hypothetical protein
MIFSGVQLRKHESDRAAVLSQNLTSPSKSNPSVLTPVLRAAERSSRTPGNDPKVHGLVYITAAFASLANVLTLAIGLAVRQQSSTLSPAIRLEAFAAIGPLLIIVGSMVGRLATC